VLHHRSLICGAVIPALLLASSLDAQIIRMPRRSLEPGAFFSLAIGMRQQASVADGRSGSTWDFGQGVEYRASLEHHLRAGTSVGIAYGRSTMPLHYSSALLGTDGEARLQSLMLTLHGGGSSGLHQVFDLGAGITRYSNFRRDSDGAPIAGAPARDDDLSFSLGYGIGYAFSARSAVTVVQEYGLIIHQRTGLTGTEPRSQQVYTTRVGVRLGFGQKRR
jgi:hypothetical protein